MKHKVVTLENKPAGEIELLDTIFGVEVRRDLLARVVHWQRNKMRQGTHKTKGISEISGTGKKPFKQKGTGNARQGSLRSPQFRGGATIFGPVVRSHATDLPKSVRVAGLKAALASKLATKKLIIIDQAVAKTHKTKAMISALGTMDVKSVLFITSADGDANFARAIGNIPHVSMVPQIGANVYDILRHDHLIMTVDAAKQLQERLS